jgi:hypothetical protein
MFFHSLQCFTLKTEQRNDSYSQSKYLRAPFVENKPVLLRPDLHKQMSFVSNGGKFKLYTVRNGLIFPTSTQLRISFERAILH